MSALPPPRAPRPRNYAWAAAAGVFLALGAADLAWSVWLVFTGPQGVRIPLGAALCFGLFGACWRRTAWHRWRRDTGQGHAADPPR